MEIRDTFAEKQARSYRLEGLKEIVEVLEAVSDLPRTVVDATLKVWDSSEGIVLAEVWWDGESECWVADLQPDEEQA